MDATLLFVPARFVYMEIPHRVLRDFSDGLFPALKTNLIADSVRGFGHRYVGGHDLLLDVPRTLLSHGPMESLRHAGHVLLTDFPTKAGIPIPGLSHSGLGSILETVGIHRGWFSLNLCDAGFGFMAWAEGSAELVQALNGSLTMTWGTFFDTFATGGLEIGIGVSTQNLPLTIGGIENILAGAIATWNSLSVYVDPLDFFGAAGMSTLIGFALAYGLAGENLSEAGLDAIRSGAVGALFTLSPAFGYGVLAGFSAYRLGGLLAKKHNESTQNSFSLNEEAYRLLVEEICKGNAPVRALVERAIPQIDFLELPPALSQQSMPLCMAPKHLSENGLILGNNSTILQDNSMKIASAVKRLPEDPSMLADWYRNALNEAVTYPS